MQTIYAVIGANYGDEGKGLFTDFLARFNDAERVVRYNGGAQAGHTVVEAYGGERHVFSTFGSGSFSELSTSYTPEVIVNPYAIHREYEELLNKGVSQRLHISTLSPVTTQYEIMLNQLAEQARGNDRHGSCGLGINETVERHNAMLAVDPMLPQLLHNPKECAFALDWIHNVWLPKRMTDMALPNTIEVAQARAKKLAFANRYMVSYNTMKRACLAYPGSVAQADTRLNIQYEGAQGLAIDEELGAFPYVTRSTTGLPNILKDIKRRLARSGTPNEHIKLKVVYASRTYLTRHGRGPLPNEASVLEVLGKEFEDKTNVTNLWQDHLRFAPLDLYEMSKRIEADLTRCQPLMADLRNNVELMPCIALSHADVAETFPVYTRYGGLQSLTPEAIANKLRHEHDIPVVLTSYGPTFKDVRVTHQGFIKEEEGAIATD